MKKLTYIIVVMLTMSTTPLFSKENIGEQRKANPGNNFAAGCVHSTNAKNLDLNNVRCPIQMNGDMWWDLVNNIARYEVPKGSGKTSLFAGAIWIGGHDQGGNLKLAAQTYRQSGVDFWPGPLDTVTASTDPTECIKYDYHWLLLRSDVQSVVSYFSANGSLPNNTPSDILTWPGNGDASRNEGHFLAPYHDVSLLGTYTPSAGDYPDFDLSLHPTCGHLYGDQCMWWVFNDEGNIHTETGGAPIGLEVRAQAFDFVTNDDINNMTFYNYQIINRSKSTVEDTWFGAWVDPDLGYFGDDYVGCDVGRGLGYCYNGEPIDPGPTGYGANPPAVGLDFFQGPTADLHDGIDNNRNGIIDEPGEQIIMSQFVYYNNDFSVTGNPITATQYYNYLKGIWIDGTPITFGGNGHGGSVPTNFMFPGLSDPTNWGTGLGVDSGPAPPSTGPDGWTEGESNDPPGDRRFLQSAGKFTLKPGAVNYITTGAVWARTTSGGPLASVNLLQLADDKAQILFSNCFAITNGPDAPDMFIRELNNKLIISFKPDINSNDSIETNYIEKDPAITKSADTVYHFQGYQVYQFADNSVSITDIGNPDKARLVFQCDIKDTVGDLVNETYNPALNAWTAVDEVPGAANNGIQHSFVDTIDLFTSSKLVNHQTYYFTVIAYADNMNEVNADCFHRVDGLCQPYIAGRRNVTVYAAIPHIPDPQDGGLVLNSNYGDGPKVTRLEGQGNGGRVLDFDPITMTQDQINQLLSSATNYRINNPVYAANAGPIDVQIYDPVKVGNHNFTVYLKNTSDSSKWYITEMATGETDSSDNIIIGSSEKLFPQWGIKINVQQVRSMAGEGIGTDTAPPNNALLDYSMTFSDQTKQWLSGIPTSTTPDPTTGDEVQNWLFPQIPKNPTTLLGGDTVLDPSITYGKILGGTWGPLRYGSSTADGNGPLFYSPPNYYTSTIPNYYTSTTPTALDSLASVDIILTSDKTKWSRSVVIEEQGDSLLADGYASKCEPRRHKSVDKNGYQAGDPGYNIAEGDFISPNGMGWFPGYAVNVETGERLNIMFGEDSYLKADNGADMLFNPSSNLYEFDGQYNSFFGDPIFGGKHYVYIMGHSSPRGNAKTDSTFIEVAYDNCSTIKHRLDSVAILRNEGTLSSIGMAKTHKVNAWKDGMWVGFPVLAQGHSLLESDVKIRIRVSRKYQNYDVGGVYNPLDSGMAAINPKNRGIPYYSFSTTGLEAQTDQTNVAYNALALVNIVPNPYYSHSSYEQNQLDNRVKIVNLPNVCTVSIYTQNGVLVRRYDRNIPSSTDLTAGVVSTSINNSTTGLETNIDWDLKNSFGVPVAGGVYIIHINAPGLGERVIKWFGVIRPIDLDTF